MAAFCYKQRTACANKKYLLQIPERSFQTEKKKQDVGQIPPKGATLGIERVGYIVKNNITKNKLRYLVLHPPPLLFHFPPLLLHSERNKIWQNVKGIGFFLYTTQVHFYLSIFFFVSFTFSLFGFSHSHQRYWRRALLSMNRGTLEEEKRSCRHLQKGRYFFGRYQTLLITFTCVCAHARISVVYSCGCGNVCLFLFVCMHALNERSPLWVDKTSQIFQRHLE